MTRLFIAWLDLGTTKTWSDLGKDPNLTKKKAFISFNRLPKFRNFCSQDLVSFTGSWITYILLKFAI